MSEITEARLYEAFGLTPREQGAQGQEIAEPTADAQTDTDDGGDPAGNDTVEAEDGIGGTAEPGADSADPQEGDDEGQNNAGDDTQTPPMTPEERHANAARRRAQEQQAATQRAVDAAVQEERRKQNQKLEEILAQAGIKSTETGETVTTLEGLQKWSQEMAESRLQKELKSGKLTREMIDQLIASHPAVQMAQQTVQQAQVQQAQQQAQAQQARIQEQFEKIAMLNPAVKGLGDILAMDTAPAFRENVRKGMDFFDAYRLANMDNMAQEKAQRAVQAAQQSTRGKEHLRTNGNARGSGAASVPQAQLKLYRMMNPNMTDAQIQAHYNKYLKQGG